MNDGYIFKHATDIRNLSKIIKDGYLDPNIKSKYRRRCQYNWDDEYDYKRVWIQVIFDIEKIKKNKKFLFSHWGNVILIFNENILKSQKGEYGGIAYPQTVKNGIFDSMVDKKYGWLNEFVKSINEWMKFKARYMSYINKFSDSHEIRLKKKVPLARSLIGILFYNIDEKEIIKYRKMLDKAGLDQCKIENWNGKN